MAELVTKYQQYDEYKESGVEWLGEIPSHWGLVSTKRVIQEHSGNGFPIELQDDENGIIPFLKVSDISGEETYIHKCSHRVTLENIKKYKWNVVPKGSIVTGKIGEALKKNHRKILLEDSIIDNNCIAIESTGISNIFNFYVHRVIDFDWYVNPGAVPSISVQKYKAETLAIPTNSEQTQIANFLDYETAQIDTLIEKQQTLIQLLKEKRQAVISHAVTKGLNPDAPMKDSGVEWLGEVPEHWEVGRVGYYGQVLNGSTPSKANLSYWHPKEVAWLSSGEVNQYYIESPTDYISYKALKECSVTLLPVGTLVMGMIGQGKTRGTSAVTKIEATINQNLAAVIPNENLYSNYAHLFFQAAYKELREDARGGNQAALNCEIIRDFKITIPPINEQRTIFIEVNKISDKFDILIVKAEQAIELMQERRTALISAAVTGKIDVRGWRAPE